MRCLYADDHVAFAAKEAGLKTVAAPGEECLTHLLEAELDRVRLAPHGLFVVHRLDRQTSGVLVFARSPAAARDLARQFARRTVEREYLAVVHGSLATDAGTIATPVDDKRAVTHYTVTRRGADTTTVRVRLETGRKNQIRAHFAGLGHPLLGDARFGGDAARHAAWPHASVALHARVLGIRHPKTRHALRFELAPPDTFGDFMVACP